MNIGECILVGLAIVTAGIVALTYIAGKYDLIDKKNKK